MRFKGDVAKAMWEKGYEVNKDEPYGKCVYDFAGDWAEQMEKALESGLPLSLVARESAHIADEPHGVTGFMYGAAVSILSQCWERGEELRRWHNLDVQMNDEGEKANESGGVLNPALLVIGE